MYLIQLKWTCYRETLVKPVVVCAMKATAKRVAKKLENTAITNDLEVEIVEIPLCQKSSELDPAVEVAKWNQSKGWSTP